MLPLHPVTAVVLLSVAAAQTAGFGVNAAKSGAKP